MGILVCYDDFTYDVVSDLPFDGASGNVVGFDSSCEWEKSVVEEVGVPESRTEPGRFFVFTV